MKSKIKAYLLDDEPAISSVIGNLLGRYAPQIEVVGTHTHWTTAIEEVKNLRPDVVFLDIRMQGGTGFDFLNAFGKERGFQVVFVTGFEDYALQAIKAEALDYLLKPIDPEELVSACQRIEERMEEMQNRPKEERSSGYFMVSAMEKKVKVLHQEIAHAQASGNYTIFWLQNGEKYMLAKTLKEVELQLEETGGFIRTNRDSVVNMKEVKSYSMHPPFELVLRDGTRLPISRRKKAEVIQRLESAGV